MLALADKLDEGHQVPRGQGRPRRRRSKKLKAQSMRKKAEKMENDAKDDEGLRASTSQCGQAYLDIYNRNPEAADNDEVLYNAGVCFEEGRSIGVAIQMFNAARRSTTRTARSRRSATRSPRQGVRRHRVLRPRVGEAREVREEVRRREGRVRRDERRGVLPQGYRRRRQGDRRHQVLHQDVRHEEAGRRPRTRRSR